MLGDGIVFEVSDHETKEQERPLTSRNLKRLRLKRGLKQEALADLAMTMPAARSSGVKISQSVVSRIEKGDIKDPSSHILRALAEAMHESSDQLWADPDQPDRADPSIDAFFKSDYAADITDDEKLAIASAHWPVRNLPPKGWSYILEAIRIARSVK